MEILAACHVHSAWSYDGSWSLEALASAFRSRGYRVLLMTEHDRGFSQARLDEYKEACVRASAPDMLVVPGIEYSDAANRVHVLVWGAGSFLGEGLPTGDLLDSVRATEGVAVLAHPSRRDAWQCFDPRWAERLLGIEFWNRKCDGWAPSRTSPRLLDTAHVIPFAGLDFHNWRQFFPLAMALDVSAPITVASVVEALRSRRCDARAFGFPLSHGLFKTARPVLGVAEHGRKRLAAIARMR